MDELSNTKGSQYYVRFMYIFIRVKSQLKIVEQPNVSQVFDPMLQGTTLEGRIIVALQKVSEAFRVLLWEKAKEHSLSPIQIQIMIFIKYHPEEMCKVAYLAQEFNLTKATISDAVKTLISKKVLRKAQCSYDNRSFVLSLTEGGDNVVNDIESYTSDFNESLQGVSDGSKPMLLQELMGIIYQLNKLNIITHQRMCFTCNHYNGDRVNAHYCGFLQSRMDTKSLRIDCIDYKR